MDNVLRLPDGTEYEGRLQTDDNGKPIADIRQCGTCGFCWNDALVTSVTPSPSGRCPNECNHEIVDPVQPSYRGLAYVNAYAVTRHYGGPEEGGWWFNMGEPLASMPIPATFQCAHERDEEGHCAGCYDDEGERLTMCRFTEMTPDENAKEHARAYLEAAFEDVKKGDIYSVRGGVDVSIRVESHSAEHWPARRPHYE